QIKRTNEIAQGSTADAIASGNVLRDSNNIGGVANSGTILAVNTAYVNANSSRVRGVDADVRQTFEIGPGQLEMDLQWSHLLKFERTEGDTTV
ncbi:TonB-dependent receptor, partial [Mesorhizobium sp. M8A.F.Ca.ET.173.01.1.1]